VRVKVYFCSHFKVKNFCKGLVALFLNIYGATLLKTMIGLFALPLFVIAASADREPPAAMSKLTPFSMKY
jgi:hypothetical protein